MQSLKAKFKVDSVTNFEDNRQGISLSAVINNCEENKSFSAYTPYGKLDITITNPAAIDFFKPGEEIYIDFSKA